MPVVWETFGIFRRDPNDFLSRLFGWNLVISLWPEDKTTFNGVEAKRPTPPQKIPSAKIRWKSSRLDVLESRRQPPHWLSSKWPNYQRLVLLISAGAIEGHLKGKRRGNVTKGVLFLHDNAPAHRALVTQKKLAYLGFQCLDHPPYSPDLAPSNYHLFPGLNKQLKVRHFSSDVEVIAIVEAWLDGQHSDFFFLSVLQKSEKRAKKFAELRGEYVE